MKTGALLPAKPLPLRQGERVMLLIVRQADPSRWDMARVAAPSPDDDVLARAGLDLWMDELDGEDCP